MQVLVFMQKISDKLVLVTSRLIKRKPLFLARVFFLMLLQCLRKRIKLRSILFHTHYKCNLNCSHCYEKFFDKTDKKPLTLDEKKKIISDCLKLGIISFDFVSGESILDPNLPELIKAAHPKITYITLATNGYGFTEEKIRYLLDIGVDKLNISIDSWYPEEHDAIRGKKGVHESAFKTLELCKKVGLGFQITTFVYKNSTKTDGFKKLIEYAIANRIRVTFKLAVPLGAWEEKLDRLITKEDRDFMFRLHRKYPFLVRTCISNEKSSCPAFDKLLTITAYGDVLPCNTIHISFGNLREESLKAIINKARTVKYFNLRFRGCPSAEDIKFIESYLSKTYNAYPYPIKAEEVFDELKKEKDST